MSIKRKIFVVCYLHPFSNINCFWKIWSISYTFCSRPLLLEVENKDFKTPLIQAVEKKDLSLVTLLITLGANVNNPSSYTKRSPLMVAVSSEALNIAAFLVDKGCNTKAQDVNGLNILHYAVDSNNIESVKFCLQQDIDVNKTDRNGWTPLHRSGTQM